MPKTKNAFALRDFDEKRILARFYSFDDEEDSSILVQWGGKLHSLKNMKTRTDDYAKRIMKHQEKLIKYLLLLVEEKNIEETQMLNRIQRVRVLRTLYDKVLFALAQLKESLEKIIEKAKEIECRGRFSERLKQARTEAGLTQSQLAEKLGMRQSSYSSYENAGTEPSLATLSNISKILKRPTDWLLGLTP